jgi:hypothetical protein
MALRETKRERRPPTPPLPPELKQYTAHCSACGQSFSPPWFEKLEWPIEFVAAADGTGHWGGASARVPCGNCRASVEIRFPRFEARGTVTFLGDEAVREPPGQLVYTYSLVGGSPAIVNAASDEIRAIKARYLPEAQSATLHMKDLWAGSARQGARRTSIWPSPKCKDWLGICSSSLKPREPSYGSGT